MPTQVDYLFWQEDDAWLGYLQDYPDYWTQGESLDDLIEHLKDLYLDLSGGKVTGRSQGEALVLTAAEQLDEDAQAELVAILSRRLAECGRERVVETVEQSRREFAAGQCRPMTAAELVREALS